MAISLPQPFDPLNIPDHALSHRVFANDSAAPEQSVVVDSTGLTTVNSLTETIPTLLKLKDNLIVRISNAGEIYQYNTATNTDIARGILLMQAVSDASSGDTIYLANNTFDLDNNCLDTSLGNTGYVNLKGSGKYTTIIKSSYGDPSLITQPIIIGASYQTISDLSIIGTSPGITQYQACYGVKDIYLTRDIIWANINCVYMEAGTDGFYFIGRQGIVHLNQITTKTLWDSVVFAAGSSSGLMSEFHIRNSLLQSINGSNSNGTRCIVGDVNGSDYQTINVSDTEMISTSVSTATGVSAGTRTIFNIDNARITTTAPTRRDLFRAGYQSSININIDCVYDATTTVGTINIQGNIGNPVFDSLVASKVVFTDASKKLTSTGIGTAAQFIKGDGSLDSNTYASSADLAGYLTLDQTTPQTTVGTFTFLAVSSLDFFSREPFSLYGTGGGNPNITGIQNVFLGHDSGIVATTAENNVCIGPFNGQSITTGGMNILIGASAGTAITDGSDNICIGTGTGDGIVHGTANVCIGDDSGAIFEGYENTFVGTNTGWLGLGGNFNTAIGGEAGANMEGSNNVMLGAYAGSYQTLISNRLFIDNQDRGSSENEETNALITGTFDLSPLNQTININAGVSTFLGSVTAQSFIGDGSGITGVVTRNHTIQLSGDLRGWYQSDPNVILLDTDGSALSYPDGITITNWKIFCGSSPTTQLAATISYCDPVTSAVFPGASPVVVDTIATTAGYQTRTDMSLSTSGTGDVPASKILYLAMTANPVDFNEKWTLIINFTTN